MRQIIIFLSFIISFTIFAKASSIVMEVIAFKKLYLSYEEEFEENQSDSSSSPYLEFLKV
ncbi:MAG TPA: hypothetical protein VHA52_09930 [Candidatus Babeliaceae bacterium]|nr:hypothetical protein [Candidatus Babeliaceae bacterium]